MYNYLLYLSIIKKYNNMKKFKNVVELKGSILNYNKFDIFVFGELEGRVNGDWGVYEDEDIVSYDFDLLEKYDDDDLNYIDSLNDCLSEDRKVNLNELKEYIGEGICYENEFGNWYNVEFKDDIMVISFICVKEI
jgi:hypothetical protein